MIHGCLSGHRTDLTEKKLSNYPSLGMLAPLPGIVGRNSIRKPR